MRRDAGEAFIVAEQDPGSRIGQAIFKFAACPPGVERRDDGADNAGGKKGHRPFGQVAHDDGDTIALLHAIGDQLRRQPQRGAGEIFKGDAFIVEDEEDLFAMRAPGEEDIAQRRRGVFPGPRRPATDDDGLHFQWRSRRGQHGMGLGYAHRWKGHSSSPDCGLAAFLSLAYQSPSARRMPAPARRFGSAWRIAGPRLGCRK